MKSIIEMACISICKEMHGVLMSVQPNYLASLNVPVKLEKEVCKQYDIVLLKALFNVDDMCLPLAPNAVLKRVADDSLQFQIGNAIEGFPEWKASQLSKMPA